MTQASAPNHARPRRGRRAVLPVAAAALLTPLVVLAVSLTRGVPLEHAVEDPAATTGRSPLLGVLSNLGAVTWCAGAGCALLAAHVLVRAGDDRRLARFLLLGGLITAYLAVDDLFLIHDDLVVATPIPQPLFLAALGGTCVWFLVAFRDVLRRTPWPLVLLAATLFAASLGIDFVSDLGKYLDAWEIPPGATFAEDSLKWLGVIAWTAYLVRVSAAALVERTAPDDRVDGRTVTLPADSSRARAVRP